MSRRALSFCVTAALAFAIMLALDAPLSNAVYDSGLSAHLKQHHHVLLKIVRIFGNFPEFTLPVCALILIVGWRRKERRRNVAAAVFLAGVLSGSNQILKWIIGRHRPHNGVGNFRIHPFAGGIRGLAGANLSFPSGDVCLAAATAGVLAMCFPKLRAVCIGIVVLVAIERVAENAHYPSDVLGGALLGWGCARVALRWVPITRNVDRNIAMREERL